ncbi:MAG: hypothetical protein ACLFVH_04445 [Phycisphaerae bacterium]
MSRSVVIFAAESGPWRVGCQTAQGPTHRDVSIAPDATSAETAGAIAAVLGEIGCDDQPAVLAIPSEWCLAAEISTDDLGRGGRHRAMTFRLEEHLPLSAEDMVADFVEARKGSALGIAAELGRLTEWLDALGSAGIAVGSIVPMALLAARAAAREVGAVDAVLVAQPSHEGDGPATVDWIELHKGKPVRWRWFADDRSALREAVAELDRQDDPSRVVLVGEADGARLGIEEANHTEWVGDAGLDVFARALGEAEGVLNHSDPPWVELRRGPIAAPDHNQPCRGPLVAVVTAAAVLLVLLAVVFTWRGMQYDRLASRHRREQLKAFREAVPDQRPPIDILGRMRSEYRKLAGIGGETLDADTSSAALPASALVHLRNVLASLPGQMRFRILEVEIGPGSVDVRGQAKSYADAERIAAALRDTKLYAVEMHETQRLREEGVSFRFTATPVRTEGGRP